MRLRVAVVGAGFMGQLHARVITESPVAQLAAIVDVDRVAAEKVAAQFSVPLYPSVDSISEDGQVDAAIVAVPDIAHEKPASQLLQAGKAVLLEKPMAHTLDAARRIAEVARSSQSRLMVGHILRFDPRYAGAAAHVAEGAIGRPLHVTASRFTFRQVGMRMAGRSSPCFYLGIHDIDAMQWVTGRRITRLFARAVRSVIPDVLHWPETNQRIVGDLAEEVNHFLRSVRDDKDFLVPVADAVRNVAVNDAIIRSIQSNELEVVD